MQPYAPNELSLSLLVHTMQGYLTETKLGTTSMIQLQIGIHKQQVSLNHTTNKKVRDKSNKQNYTISNNSNANKHTEPEGNTVDEAINASEHTISLLSFIGGGKGLGSLPRM